MTANDHHDRRVRDFLRVWLPDTPQERLAAFLEGIPEREWTGFPAAAQAGVERLAAQARRHGDIVLQTRAALLQQALRVEIARRARRRA